MIKPPEIDKRNWKKILRELDISKYPSLPSALSTLRGKFLKKEPVNFAEESLGYARLTKYFEDFQSEINSLYLATIDYSKFSVRPPKPHQKPAVEFLLKNNKCILADVPGGGKSLSAIMAALSMESNSKILLITLKSLKYNFAKEISYLCDDYAVVDKEWIQGKFTIVHYDALNKFIKNILANKFDIVIIDECHLLKNKKSKRSQLVTSILASLNPSKLWLLTGTPINNKPIDFYPLLKMLKHPISKNWVKFVERYCEGAIDRWGRWQTGGASNLKELHELTKAVILRRSKTDMGIPLKNRKPLFLELKNIKGYNQVIDDYKKKKYDLLVDEVDYDGDQEDISVEEITKLMLYRQFCAMEKIKDGSLIELIDGILDEDDENKIIVFTNFTKVIDVVYEHYGSDMTSFIDGRILDSKKRLEIMDDFNENPNRRVLVLNIKAGGTGLNGQGANYVIVNDMDWVPANMLQAEDRANRLSSTKELQVIYPVYDKTVETVLYNVVEEKMRVISTIVEGKEEEYFGDTERKVERDLKAEKKSIINDILAQMGF